MADISTGTYVSNTMDVETDHEYDGIREFDNPLPRWWLITFWGTIIFAMGYWAWYHSIPNQPGSYELHAAEMESVLAAQASAPVADDELLALAADPAVVAAGKATFMTTCLACHGDKGQGLVGPNLTDAWTLYGDKPSQIHKVVSQGGAPDKGMVAWGPQLGSTKVKEVSAYVLTLKGTNVPGKAPQGKDASGVDAPAAAP